MENEAFEYKAVNLEQKEKIEFFLRNLVARILIDCAHIEYEGQYELEITAIADAISSEIVTQKP